MNRRLFPIDHEGHHADVDRYVIRTEDTDHKGTTVRLFYMNDGTVQTHVVGHGFTRCACGCGGNIDPDLSYRRMMSASPEACYWASAAHKERARRHSMAVLAEARESLLRVRLAEVDRLADRLAQVTAERDAMAEGLERLATFALTPTHDTLEAATS